MNKKLILSLLIGTTLCFTGCSDDDIVEENIYPSSNSEDIGIGANGGYSQNEKNSRTIYTGNESAGNPDGTGKVEYINWIDGTESYAQNWGADEILIYSPQAKTVDNQNTASYKLISHEAQNTGSMFTTMKTWYENTKQPAFTQATADRGQFQVSGSPTGLRWDKNKTVAEHQFFAVYPSPNLNPTVKLYKDLNNSDVWFEGQISSRQQTIGYIKDPKDTNGKTYIAMPVMRQNYMYAAHQATSTDATSNSIGMQFKTIPTILEVELVWPENTEATNYTVQGVMLSTTDPSIELAGKFKAKLNLAQDGRSSVSDVQLVPAEGESPASQKSVYIDMDSDHNDGIPGVRMKAGDHLKVRFVLLPGMIDNSSKLKLTVVATKDVTDSKNQTVTVKGMKSHALPKGFIIQTHKLNKIKNVAVPLNMAGNNWLTLMNDNVLLSQLSIPGTGGSYVNPNQTPLTDWDEEQRAQVLNIQGQWDMGIRCFELALDKQGPVNGFLSRAPFQDQEIRISNDHITSNTKFKDQMTQLLAQLSQKQYEKEFAMVIIRYQPDGERDANRFIKNFNTYFGGLDKTKFAIFQPNLTLGDVRGKIMILLCPTSEGEDNLDLSKMPDYDPNANYLLINGCGSLPDKFYKRNYVYTSSQGPKPVIPEPAINFYLWEEANRKQTAEYYLNPSSIGQLAHVADDPITDPKVGFNYGTNKGFKVYYQEWPRVIDGAAGTIVTSPNGYYAWHASYDEKINDIKQTLNKAVGDKANVDHVYINSLCGYLVGTAHHNGTHLKAEENDLFKPLVGEILTPWPSLRGNVKDWAAKVNDKIYRYIHEQLGLGKKGPMGIVLMNRVGETSVNSSMLMPNIVIMNNFSFPLLTSGGTSKSATRALNCSPSGEAGELDASDWKW